MSHVHVISRLALLTPNISANQGAMPLSAPSNDNVLSPRDHKQVSKLSTYANAPRVFRRNHLTRLENRLSGEIDIESILALDEQIRQHERAIINLKRTRNSLLNVSKLPPEVLGNVFRWNVSLKDDFDGLEEGSHNFISVCHHWREVALGTPELWSFWGNSLTDWARRSRHSGTAPLDLALCDDSEDGTLDVTLSDILRDRASRDTIRRVHLRSMNSELLHSIISQITPEEPRVTNMESFILQDESGDLTVDLSNFLTRCRFPKLHRLELFNCTITSWDLLTSRTPVLTTLDLYFKDHLPSPTTSQLLSVLASYPTLQKLVLSWSVDPDNGGGSPPPRVPLHNLKDLELDAPAKDVFGLLDRLDHPRNMDNLDITLDPCPFEDISCTIGPYLRNYLQSRGRSPTGLGLSLVPSRTYSIALHVCDMGGTDFFAPVRPPMNPSFMKITIEFSQRPPGDSLGGTILDLIAHTPREEVIYYRTCYNSVAMKDVHALFPNLRGLDFQGRSLANTFPELDLDGGGEVFPSLQFILLDWVVVSDEADWNPLATFLDRRASSGNPLHTLVISGMVPPVWEKFGQAVQVYEHI